jgi:hypothetical protein
MSRIRPPNDRKIIIPALSSLPVPAAREASLPDSALPVWPVAPPGGGPLFEMDSTWIDP